MVWKEQEPGNDIWQPQEGEMLIGEVKKVDTAAAYGLQLTITKEDGTEIKTPSHKVLQARCTDVKEGDKIKIEYVRQEPPAVKGQKGMNIYRVWVDRPEEQQVN